MARIKQRLDQDVFRNVSKRVLTSRVVEQTNRVSGQCCCASLLVYHLEFLATSAWKCHVKRKSLVSRLFNLSESVETFKNLNKWL